MDTRPVEQLDVPVSGGTLRVVRFGRGARVVLGIHGVTASSMFWLPVVRHLADDFTLFAPDLRGRGHSAALPGPYGMTRHADDCAAALDHLGVERAVVAGQSMGAYVAVVLAGRRPGLVERLVLVDGGLPLPRRTDVDPDAALAAVLGPALARLQMTFPTPDAYLDFWRGHPAFTTTWNDDVEAAVTYDLVGEAPALRSRVSEAAVRADAASHLVDTKDIEVALAALRCPVTLLRATRNLVDQPPPLLSDELVARWRREVPQLEDEIVDDTNHYSIVFGDMGAAAAADRISR